MRGHKRSLNKFKEIEITLDIFCDHNGMKLNRETKQYSPKQPVVQKIKKKKENKKKFLKQMKVGNTTYQNMGCSFQRKVYSNKCTCAP